MAQRHSENTGVYIVKAMYFDSEELKESYPAMYKVICESPKEAQSKVVEHLYSLDDGGGESYEVFTYEEGGIECRSEVECWVVYPGEEVRGIELIK